MNRRFILVALVISVLTLTTECVPVRADPVRVAENRQIAALLNEYVEMKDFQNAMSLKEALGLVMEKYALKNKELPILVDTAAFKEENPEGANIYDNQVSFPPFPRLLRGSMVLDLMLRKVDPPNATYLIRDGTVLVTTKKEARPRRLLHARVLAEFHNTPLSEAMGELSAITGASIVLDNRLGDKLKAPVTASLRNDVTLEAALRMLTDMADLKVAFLPAGIYVTHPFNAQNFEREMHERKRPESGEKKHKGPSSRNPAAEKK
jgi:hypothetical protein